MGDLIRMGMAMGMGQASIIDRTLVNGVIVSTVNTYDLGFETAIIDTEKTMPVERYETEHDAKKGHAKWVKTMENDNIKTVIRIGFGEDEEWVKDEEMVLKRGIKEDWI